MVEMLVQHFLYRRAKGRVPLGRPDLFADANPAQLSGTFVPRDKLPELSSSRPGSWKDLRQRLSFNMRKNLRKTYKLLERDGCAFASRVTEGPDGVAPAMTRFFALHAARAEAADMLFHPTYSCSPTCAPSSQTICTARQSEASSGFSSWR